MVNNEQNQKNRLKANEICKIIETCGKNGVTLFFYSGIRIEFEKAGQLDLTPEPRQASPEIHEDILPSVVVQKLQQEMDEDAELERKADEVDEEIAMLMIEDPEQYEEMVARGELEDEEAHT